MNISGQKTGSNTGLCPWNLIFEWKHSPSMLSPFLKHLFLFLPVVVLDVSHLWQQPSLPYTTTTLFFDFITCIAVKNTKLHMVFTTLFRPILCS